MLVAPEQIAFFFSFSFFCVLLFPGGEKRPPRREDGLRRRRTSKRDINQAKRGEREDTFFGLRKRDTGGRVLWTHLAGLSDGGGKVSFPLLLRIKREWRWPERGKRTEGEASRNSASWQKRRRSTFPDPVDPCTNGADSSRVGFTDPLGAGKEIRQ